MNDPATFDAGRALPPTGLAAFADVDATGRPDAYIAFLDGFQQRFGGLVGAALARLALRDGDRVLDVGCGHGAAFGRLAGLVGAGGGIVGVDRSRALLAEAARRAATLAAPVELHEADARSLPLPDASVDAARADRLLIFVAEPARVLAEMVRVTRPGGRIVVTEGDLGTTVLDADDAATTRAIVDAAADAMACATIGRRLRRMFLDAGLRDVDVEPHAVQSLDAGEWAARIGLDAAARRAVRRGTADAGAVERWRHDLGQRAAEGRFFATNTLFTVSGSRP